MASVTMGTLGAGELTNSLSSAAKTSLDQQLYEQRLEVVSCGGNHYTAPNSCLSLFWGFRKVQNVLAACATGTDPSASRWHGSAFSFMDKDGTCCLIPTLWVAA